MFVFSLSRVQVMQKNPFHMYALVKQCSVATGRLAGELSHQISSYSDISTEL